MARLLARRTVLRAALAASACAGLGCLAACSGGKENVPAEPAPTNPSEGKLGGKLVLYTSCTESLVNAVVPAFMEESGTAVRVVRGTTGELLARLGQEAASGEVVADVMWGGDASWYVPTSGEKNPGEPGSDADGSPFQAYVSADNASMREGCGNVAGVATPVTREVAVIAVGAGPALDGAGGTAAAGDAAPDGVGDDAAAADDATADSAEGDAGADAATEGADATAASTGADVASAEPADAVAPTGYEDLLDRADATAAVAIERPEESAAALAHLAALRADLGKTDPDAPWAYAGELFAMAQVTSTDEAGDGEAALAAVLEGDAVCALTLEQACLASAAEGLGVSVVYPEEGTLVTCGCTAIVRDCAHLSQARAWVDFVTGEACQRALAEQAFSRPVREGVEDPSGLPEVPSPQEVAREELLATWGSVEDGSWQPESESDAAEPSEEAPSGE